MPRLEGKVALVSGGAQGLGAATALLFAREGAQVVVGDIREDAAEASAAAIRAAGGVASAVALDVRAEDSWRRAVAAAEERYGRLNVLVNNAGVPQKPGGLEEVEVVEWERVLTVNLTGVFLGCKTAVPAMRRAGGGSIVNISSIAGITASKVVAYGASKGGVRQLTKSVAIQFVKDGIRCNSVHPGSMLTDLIKSQFPTPEALAKRAESIPMGRLVKPEEVALGVLYLASDESAYVTGSELVIDGGLHAM